MARLQWDQTGEKTYETGAKKGVLFPTFDGKYKSGVAWNGLIGVTEKPTGAEITPQYADDTKYLQIQGAEDFEFQIEAYTYPQEFEACDGSANLEGIPGVVMGQQTRIPFGMVYQSTIGNDTESLSHGYKLHIIYGAMAMPSERGYKTINDNPEAITFSWECKTTPVPVRLGKPTSVITIDSTKLEAVEDGKGLIVLKAIEDMLFGTEDEEAKLPTPDELAELIVEKLK